MERDIVYCGALVGEHSFDRDNFIREIEERIISRGLDFVIINTSHVRDEDMPTHEHWVEYAKYLKDNKIHFVLVRTAQNAPVDRISRLERETVLAIREAAGEYFLGDCIAEPGHAYAAKEAGYFVPKNGRISTPKYKPKTDARDMREARDYYVDTVRKFIDNNAAVGMPASVSIEATALTKYNIEAGISLHILETPNGDPDIMMPSVRGAARNLGNDDFWGTLIAHEWYGGMRHGDMQKRKRLDLVAKFAYISGAGLISLESGDNCIASYDQSYEYDSGVCRDYRDMLSNIRDYIKNDTRPKGGPKATFGIISGQNDGWCGFCQTSLWNQFGREEFGHSDIEASWRLLGDIGKKRKWSDITNYGDNDTSAYPAYGTFDIVPVEADVEKISKYDYLVFLGYNTMTDDIMDKLVEYVRRGGRLLIGGAHLNYSTKHGGEFIPPPEDKLEALCGCRYTGNLVRSNLGSKLYSTSLMEEHLYPGTECFICDPILSGGYVTYMETEPSSGRALGFTSNAFLSMHTNIASVIENRIGEGVVTLVTAIDYPGCAALYPLYNTIFREFVSSSARNCEIKVIASDRLRYTVYEGNKVYLLNTDYDLPICVKIIYKGREQLLTLAPLELKSVQL